MRAHTLSGLHALVALNAIGGGVYGLLGAPGVPVAWLQHTPFASYLVPSIILLLVVGGSQLAAGLMIARRRARARSVSITAGIVLLGWIGTQVAMIGFVSWLQPAVAVAALANLLLAWGLPDPLRTTDGPT